MFPDKERLRGLHKFLTERTEFKYVLSNVVNLRKEKIMSEKEHRIQNPVIPGFYPDPSVCRVGDDFYLVNSSFELYPGIPVFHSRDLAHWEQISYAMYKENGFHVNANLYAGGVMAPTIRYQDGRYYIINANFGDRGNYIVTAEDPKGPWSEPHWITDVPDIDCSLFFDLDGKAYLISPGNDGSEDNGRAFFLTPYDIREMHVSGERKKIWNSAMRKASAPEAPHLYHIGEYYYLMIAEGGTEHNHSVCIARSRTIDGWYVGNPANPVLTHRHLGYEYPIENIGHADLIDTPQGNWYAVMLGVRIIEGQHMNMGRETFLCPVKWERGWPVFSPGSGKVEESYPADPDLPWTEGRKKTPRDDFDAPALDLCWSFWGTPYEDFWKTEDGCLKLKCLPRPLIRKLMHLDPAHPDMRRDDNVSFLGRRQESRDFSFSVKMTFEPENQETAGIVAMQASNHEFRFELRRTEGKKKLALVQVTTKQKGLPFLPGYESETTEKVLHEEEAGGNTFILRMQAQGQDFSFFLGSGEEDMHVFYEHADGKLINPEEVGGMVGTMLGMFASGNGKESSNWACFDWAELRNTEEDNL